MKCEECDSNLELLAEGGRYDRFGWHPSRSYQCPKCKAVYGMDGLDFYRVRSKVDDIDFSEIFKKAKSSEGITK